MYSVNSKYIKTFSHKNVFWQIPTQNNELFLTFDDGPVPGVTDFVLDQLLKYNAKATFFCVGDNIRQHPDLFDRIQKEGHAVGNHTFHHLNGWKHSLRSYINNIKMCGALTQSRLFRPPYGRLTPLQRFVLQKDHFIILWSVLPGDFDLNLSSEKCLERAIKHSCHPGSIVVFHDSLKAKDKLQHVLPAFLEYYSKMGFSFSSISEQLCHEQLEERRKKLVHQISLGMI